MNGVGCRLCSVGGGGGGGGESAILHSWGSRLEGILEPSWAGQVGEEINPNTLTLKRNFANRWAFKTD